MYLLDTNICIYLIKNRYPSLTEQIRKISPNEAAISAITLYELEYGSYKSKWGERTRDKFHTFLSPLSVIPFEPADAQAAGCIRAALEEEGNPIGPYDLLIAAQAYARNMTVVTHNMREFSRIPGLKVEDWVRLS